MRFIIEFPDPSCPGSFTNDPKIVQSREEAMSYLEQWFPGITAKQARLFIMPLEDED